MNDTHTAALLAAHPTLFRQLRAFGFECSDGWFDLLSKLFADIEAQLQLAGVAPADYPAFLIVKEKFGTLRVQGGDCSDAVSALIDAAGVASQTICEVCGAAGVLARRRRGVRVLCAVHAAQNPAIDRDTSRPSVFSLTQISHD